MEATELRRAIEAASTTTAALGLQVDEAVVLNNSDRVVLRLIPGDVLVRIGPLAHRAGFEFEVEVARRLTEVGGPVAELDPRTEPRVHVRDSFVISLWTYYEPLESEITPAQYAEALVRHHAALRTVDLDAPHFTDRVAEALKEVDDKERTPALPDTDRELLSHTLRSMGAAVSEETEHQLLHGEPHPGNLLNTHKGPLFVDLETCCRGPIEFDLAHAPQEVGEHCPEANADVIHRCRALVWAMVSAWRWREADQFPDRDHWRVEGLNRVRAALDPR